MADWRIRKRFGHGAARVVLCPEPSRGAASGVSFAGALRDVGPELFGGVKSGVAFGLVIMATFFVTVMRDRVDLSNTQLAVWSTPEPVAKVEPPPPVPKLVPAKPEPVVEKKIAKVKPKPPPVPKAKPKPVPVKVAKVVKPKPAPKPVAKVKPKPRKPKIEMAALAKKPDVPKAAPLERKRAVTVQPEQRRKVALAAAAMKSPALSDVAPSPSRAQRVTNETKRRAAPTLAVANSSLPLPDATTSHAPQRTAPAFARAKTKARPNLQLAAAASPVVANSSPAPAARRTAVVANTPTSRKSRVDIGSAPAALAPRSPAPVANIPIPNRVTARAEAPSGRSRSADPNMSLGGVSLGSLASCMSDREEDLLKQRVLAAVRNREVCASSIGTYRFVETKNLNAFSMWIERSPGRGASDRCAELTHALACLE